MAKKSDEEFVREVGRLGLDGPTSAALADAAAAKILQEAPGVNTGDEDVAPKE